METMSVVAYSLPHPPPSSCGDEAVDMAVDVNPIRVMDTQVFPIPDSVPDERLEKLCELAKSRFEKYITTPTLNPAERTITISQEYTRLKPAPALNTYGQFELTSSTVFFPEHRATKLIGIWPLVESTLYEFAISCKLNEDRCYMQVSSTEFLKDPSALEGARDLLQLLSASPVPPHMALELFQGGFKQHQVINIGDQEGGLCAEFKINKVDYYKRWACLFYSLQELSKASQCHIFLTENTLIAVSAVGSTVERMSWLEGVVQNCITKNLCPATSIRKECDILMEDGLEDPHAKHMEMMVKSGPSLIKDSLPEACSLFTLLPETRASKLLEASLILESTLNNYGISCNLEKEYMTFTTTRLTKEPDTIDKAWQLLEILSTTHVPVSLAIAIMDGSMQACLMKIGFQEGGFCSKYGINEEEYHIRWDCLRHSLQAVAELTECNVFLNHNSLAAVGDSSLELLEQIVVNCVYHNVCPGTACIDHNFLFGGLEDIEDPHIKHMEMENSGSPLHMLEVSSFCTFLSQRQATLLSSGWSIVESCLQKHDISCKLVSDKFYMMVSVTIKAGESNISDKIWDILQLISSAQIPPLEVIQVLDGGMYYDFIPTGSEYGGFCIKYGITKEEFDQAVWPRVKIGLRDIGNTLKCAVVADRKFVTVCGPREDIGLFRDFVQQCFKWRGRPGSMSVGRHPCRRS